MGGIISAYICRKKFGKLHNTFIAAATLGTEELGDPGGIGTWHFTPFVFIVYM